MSAAQPETPNNSTAGCLAGCLLAFVAAVAAGAFFLSQRSASDSTDEATAHETTEAKADLPANAIRLTFTYGSEKKKWIAAVTDAFNAGGHRTRNDRPIHVDPIPMGSGESIDELLTGRRQAHLTSPASAAFIKLGNARSRAQSGKDLLGETQNLVLSPVVIAMWKPMAEAIGWGKKPVGWSDIIELAKSPKGWSAHGHPEWGRFKFGHTHPEFSNSGLISLFAECYAGAGKVRDLTLADLSRLETGAYLAAVEQAVVHYGSSTGFFGRKMFGAGPAYLSAAVLYENMVIESYSHQPPLDLPVVAIYPKEGTFWSDHPVGIVNRDWVGEDEREAAGIYIEYLLDPAQQRQALRYGFRPAEVEVELAAPVDAAHGVDPQEPRTTLEVPDAEVMDGIIKLWKKHKKHANVILVLDKSGSMKEEERMQNAKDGALALLDMLGPQDRLSVLAFDNRLTWLERGALLKDGRERIRSRLNGLFPNGGTALYDATHAAFAWQMKNPTPDRISAIVVLTDGEDTNSQLPHSKLIAAVRSDNEMRNTRIFTIAYGQGAQRERLAAIADATQAKTFRGSPATIREVFKEIATFF